MKWDSVFCFDKGIKKWVLCNGCHVSILSSNHVLAELRSPEVMNSILLIDSTSLKYYRSSPLTSPFKEVMVHYDARIFVRVSRIRFRHVLEMIHIGY